MKRTKVLGLFACVTFFALQASAQLSTVTSLVGTVRDSSGAVIPNANVTALNVGTADKYAVSTNADGDYNIPFVHIGTYSITASSKGFQTVTRTGILVEINQTVRTDFTLPLGQVSQAVTVSGTLPAVKTDDASISQIVETQQINNLPLNGRDPLLLAITTPGVILGPKSPSNSEGEDFEGAGAREIQNDVTLDGVSLMNNLVNITQYKPSVDAIQEFQIQTGTYGAQYGDYMGVHMNLVTKSGTNQLHGSAFEFVRNTSLDARQFFQSPTVSTLPYHLNQFGATFGGPVMIPKVYDGKDKTFVFFDYEGLRQLQSTPEYDTVLTTDMRSGNFSQISTPIHDPLLPGDPVLAGNTIPSAAITPQTMFLLKFMPTPNLPGLSDNYLASVANNETSDQTIDRVDQNIGEKARIFLRGAGEMDTLNIGTTNPTGGTLTPRHTTNIVLGYSQIFKPTLVNDFRFGVNELAIYLENYFYNNPTLDAINQTINIPGFAYDPVNPGPPIVSTSGYMSIGNGSTNWFQSDETWETADQLNDIHGRHSIIMGLDFMKRRTGRAAVNEAQGEFIFNGQLSGSAPADLMLGLPYEDITPAPELGGLATQWNYSFFAQDKFDATRRLTITYGARYELPLDPYTNNGVATLLNSTDTAGIGGTKGFVFAHPVHTDIAPRIGFAYRLTDKWVVRGGYGIYYDPNQMNSFTFLNTNPPYSNVYNYFNTNVTSPIVTLSNPTPAAAFAGFSPTPNWITLGIPWFAGTMDQWSFDVERALWRNAGIDVQYLGNYSYHLDYNFYSNSPMPGPGAVQARRPNPSLGSIRTISNNEDGHYDALNVVLTQHMNHGATFLAAYTWSHCRDFGTDSNGGNQPMDPYDIALDYGNCNWDIRNRIVAQYSYALPFFQRSSNVAERYTLGGWQLNGVAALQSGEPINVLIAGDVANIGQTGSQRPNLIAPASASCGSGHLTGCITAAAFAEPAPYTFGDAGRNILTGPGLADFDFSLFKNFTMRERATLQFRAEFFNFFNTPQFSNPAATFGTASFGNVTSTVHDQREIQFGLKFLF